MFARISTLGCICFLLVLAASGMSFAKPSIVPGPIPATVTKVIDGDTVAVEAYIWPNQWIAVHVRVRGIDAPEIHGSCDDERQKAETAKNFVAELLRQGTATLTDINIDKYGGRVVANVITPEGASLGPLLLKKGLAHPYSGGHKPGWCANSSDRD